MVLYNLNSYEILTVTAILVPALSAIWVIFLQRDLSEKIIIFKKGLKEYRKKKSEELLKKVLADVRGVKELDNGPEKYEKSLEVIMDYSDKWSLKTEAINRLLSMENQIYKFGRYVIILLAIVLGSSLYSSAAPDDFILGSLSRIDATQVLFAIELLVVIYWIWIIFNYGVKLNKVQSGQPEDIEELIKNTEEEILNEEESPA